jgi:hypothetical protein
MPRRRRGDRRPQKWSLAALDYQWAETPKWRVGVGLRWRCIAHINGDAHLLETYFLNPLDLREPVFVIGARAVWRYGERIEDFTFIRPGGGDTLDFGKCGRLRVIDGHVEMVF